MNFTAAKIGKLLLLFEWLLSHFSFTKEFFSFFRDRLIRFLHALFVKAKTRLAALYNRYPHFILLLQDEQFFEFALCKNLFFIFVNQGLFLLNSRRA